MLTVLDLEFNQAYDFGDAVAQLNQIQNVDLK